MIDSLFKNPVLNLWGTVSRLADVADERLDVVAAKRESVDFFFGGRGQWFIQTISLGAIFNRNVIESQSLY